MDTTTLASPIILFPNQVVDISSDRKIYFLAGPIAGGDKWQEHAITLLSRKDPQSIIVCPHHALRFSKNKAYKDENCTHTMWERKNIAKAGKLGCVVIWLPRKREFLFDEPKGCFGKNTRGEIPRISTSATSGYNIFSGQQEGFFNFVIGAEPHDQNKKQFEGLSTIKQNLYEDLGKAITFYDNIESLVTAAIKEAHKKRVPAYY